jgi:23S rRNA-/tRNA-specific pseudouridylate synthase
VCRNKEVQKEYLALSIGVPTEPQFIVDAPIDKDDREK